MEAQLKSQLMQQEFSYQLAAKRYDEEALIKRETKEKKRKAKRISQQNTEQSKLINNEK